MAIKKRIVGKLNGQFFKAACFWRARLGAWSKPRYEPFWRLSFNRNINNKFDYHNHDIQINFDCNDAFKYIYDMKNLKASKLNKKNLNEKNLNTNNSNANNINENDYNTQLISTASQAKTQSSTPLFNQQTNGRHCLNITAKNLIHLQLITPCLKEADLENRLIINHHLEYLTNNRQLSDVKNFRFKWQPIENWLPAFIAYLDCWFPPQDALCLALSTHGTNSWPATLDDLPVPVDLPQPIPPSPKIIFSTTHLSPIYAIVPNADWVERLLKEKVSTIQLRIKPDNLKLSITNNLSQSNTLQNSFKTYLSEKELRCNDKNRIEQNIEQQNKQPTTNQIKIENEIDWKVNQEIEQAVALGKQYGGQVWINDNWQAAIRAGAYGVHLGQEDLQQANLLAIKKAGLRLGISTHGFYEMSVAHAYRPSYLAFGPIFPTQTKQIASAPQGVQRLQQYVAIAAKDNATVAIGGINQSNLAAVTETGVDSIAMVSAFTQAENLGNTILNIKKIRNAE